MPDVKAACATCMYWQHDPTRDEEDGSYTNGTCHYSPPAPHDNVDLDENTPTPSAWWPWTWSTDWCGKYKRRK